MNNIIVLYRRHGYSAQEAYDQAGELLKKRCRDWHLAYAKVPSWGEQVDRQVERYIQGVQDGMIANLNWRCWAPPTHLSNALPCLEPSCGSYDMHRTCIGVPLILNRPGRVADWRVQLYDLSILRQRQGRRPANTLPEHFADGVPGGPPIIQGPGNALFWGCRQLDHCDLVDRPTLAGVHLPGQDGRSLKVVEVLSRGSCHTNTDFQKPAT